MSTYQPGIPTGTVDLSVDYQNLQNNFKALDDIFASDHVTYSSATAQRGYHANMHFNPVSTTTTNPPNNQPVNRPAAIPGFAQMFTAQVNDGINLDESLYFLTGGNRLMQMTRNFQPVAASNGYTFLPGGLIFQWGVLNNPGASGKVEFATNNINFTSSLFNVQITVGRTGGFGTSPTAGVVVINSGLTFDRTQFNYLCSTGGNASIYWTAIGI